MSYEQLPETIENAVTFSVGWAVFEAIAPVAGEAPGAAGAVGVVAPIAPVEAAGAAIIPVICTVWPTWLLRVTPVGLPDRA